MKSKSLIFVFIFAFISFAVHADDKAAYSLNVANFNSLTVVDGIGVDYSCKPDSAGWAVFSAPPELASKISFSNNKEHLRIQTMSEESPLQGLPRIKVYSAALTYVENSGDSLVRVNATVPVPKFTAKQIGNGSLEVTGITTTQLDGDAAAGKGNLTVEGKAEKAKFRNVGTGAVDASSLECDNMSCFILGPGKIDTNVSGRLKVTGAGSGRVINHAKAEKVSNRSIGIKVEEAGD